MKLEITARSKYVEKHYLIKYFYDKMLEYVSRVQPAATTPLYHYRDKGFQIEAFVDSSAFWRTTRGNNNEQMNTRQRT